MTFKDLGVIPEILEALDQKGYTHPTPIQEQAIPFLLEKRDLLGCAQTGTGKTAAFTIPILQHLANDYPNQRGQRKIKALIITPTRELAIQIADNITEYSKNLSIRNTVIFGGVKPHTQKRILSNGVDILVATPGRLLDLANQGFVSFRDIEYFVLDEADQMLDMGFIHDIKRVLKKLPAQRQSLFFSATMPKSIVELSGKILGNPHKITIKPEQATAERVGQSIYYVSKKQKIDLLIHLIHQRDPESVLVFSRTKHGADKIVKKLDRADIKSAAIHGNKSQNARQRALGAFKDGKLSVLVATDIAARGIDVSELELVVNYDLPNVPETYVHRIGRTGRASASGEAISFCMGEERPYLKGIQKLINQTLPIVEDHPYPDDGTIEPPKDNAPNQRRKLKRPASRRGGSGNSGGGNRNKKSFHRGSKR